MHRRNQGICQALRKRNHTPNKSLPGIGEHFMYNGFQESFYGRLKGYQGETELWNRGRGGSFFLSLQSTPASVYGEPTHHGQAAHALFLNHYLGAKGPPADKTILPLGKTGNIPSENSQPDQCHAYVYVCHVTVPRTGHSRQSNCLYLSISLLPLSARWSSRHGILPPHTPRQARRLGLLHCFPLEAGDHSLLMETTQRTRLEAPIPTNEAPRENLPA